MIQNRTFFQDHISRLGRDFGIGTLIYFGIGKAGPAAAQACLDSGAAKIVMTEADPVRAQAIRTLCAGAAHAQLREVAIADRAGQQDLRIFNIKALSSRRAPAGLEELFPGLRQTGTVQVQAETAADILQAAAPLEPGPNVLAIDCPGEEGGIITQLLASGSLTAFRHIFLNASATPVYEGGPAAADILQQLHKAGWRIRHADEQDPDFPAYLLELEPLALKAEELEQALAEARAGRCNLEAECQRLTRENTHLTAERDEALKNLTAQTTRAVDHAVAEERERGEGALKAAQERAGKAVAEAGLAQQNLAVALRMQSLRETDLREMQMRYAALLRQKEDQDSLLRRIGDSLGGVLDAPAARKPAPPRRKPAAKSAAKTGKKTGPQ